MARYSILYTGNELTKLRDGLDILERFVDKDNLNELEMYLYCIVHDEYVLDAAKEAIMDNSEEFWDESGSVNADESSIELSEIAIAIPIGGTGTIDALHGRGIPIDDLEFAYVAGEGEGVRTMSFVTVNTTNRRLSIDGMSEKALAETDVELPEFFKQKGNAKAMVVNHKVQRNEEATVNTPPTPEPSAPAIEPQGGISKQTSLRAIVEGWIG